MKPKKQLFDIFSEFEEMIKNISEREAARSLCEKYDVLYKSFGGHDRVYTEQSLRKKLIEYRVGKLKQNPYESRDITDLIKNDISKSRERAEEKELKRKYDALIKLNEELEERYDAALRITQPVDVFHIKPSKLKKNSATAIVLLSDWHVEERVDAETINGINEYNPEIAKSRAENVIKNSLKLVNKEREHSDIEDLVLWLGGDFITGYIHPELEESNYMSPIEAIMFVQSLLLSALNFYQESGNFKRIIVPCNIGNHGRIHQKPRVSTANKNSYEYMMYHQLKNANTKAEFIIPEGMYTYLSLYDKLFRFCHGDHIKFQGGIGGLTVPLVKAMMRADMQKKAYYNFMGHYHQLWEATNNTMVNGSLIGYGAYAQKIGASPEPPMQGLRIMDSKRGLTAKFPIFCD